MNLAEAALGSPVTVKHVGGDRPFRRRLMELGLVPGTEVMVVRVAPLGDPVELRVRGCSLSIRRSEARSVEIVREARTSAPDRKQPAQKPEPREVAEPSTVVADAAGSQRA